MFRSRSELGQVIKDRLKELEMTQAELAEKMAVSQSVISSTITGGRYVSDEDRIKLGLVLNTDLTELPQPVGRQVRGRPSHSEVGKAIRKALKQRSMTQAEFASRVGIAEGSMSKIVHGSLLPSKQNYLKITSFLGIDLPEPETLDMSLQRKVEDLGRQMDTLTNLVTDLIAKFDRAGPREEHE